MTFLFHSLKKQTYHWNWYPRKMCILTRSEALEAGESWWDSLEGSYSGPLASFGSLRKLPLSFRIKPLPFFLLGLESSMGDPNLPLPSTPLKDRSEASLPALLMLRELLPLRIRRFFQDPLGGSSVCAVAVISNSCLVVCCLGSAARVWTFSPMGRWANVCTKLICYLSNNHLSNLPGNENAVSLNSKTFPRKFMVW